MIDDGAEFQVNEVVTRGGQDFRYLGSGRWENVERLEKRFSCDEGEPLSGVRSASSRLAKAIL